MNKAKFYIILFFLLTDELALFAQQRLTLDEALRLAKLNTIEYREQENNFLKEYLSFKHFRTSLLPRISFSVNPFAINRTITERYDFENNIETFRQSSTISSNTGLNVSQLLPWTGGNLKVGGFLSRIENFGDSKITSYNSTPFRISYSQSLFVHNPYRWDRVEVPLKYKLAKLHFLQYEQELNQKVVQLYFSFIKASQLYELAQTELNNADTLLNSGNKLLQINAITPNELIEIELKNANARVLLDRKKQELLNAIFELSKFLRIDLQGEIQANYPDTIPNLILEPGEILELTRTSNPFYMEIEQEMISLQRSMDQTKRQNGFNANIDFSYGLNKGSNTLKEAFVDPLSQQTGSVTISIPVFNWGESNDKIKLARLINQVSELKMTTKTEVFEQNIQKKVLEYNLNSKLVANSKGAKDLAFKTYNLKIQQYKLGQVKLEELNNSLAILLQSKTNYIESILQFWAGYYDIQKLVLHDLKTHAPLTADFEKLANAF